MSVLDDPDTGPKFGADGLIVMMLSPFQTKPDGLEKIASSKLGTFYEVRPDKVRHVFSSKDDRRGTELLWLRTYSGVYAEGEEIPYAYSETDTIHRENPACELSSPFHTLTRSRSLLRPSD